MGAWIEIEILEEEVMDAVSHPTMGAWIEIMLLRSNCRRNHVAPHDGCVDWNHVLIVAFLIVPHVAPHDGCVDWNQLCRFSKRTHAGRTPRWVRGLK